MLVVLLLVGTAFQTAVAEVCWDDPGPGDDNGTDDIPGPFRDLAALVAGLMAVTTDTNDTDGDGLPDSVEWVIGTAANASDSDHDRLDDYWEVNNSLNPNDLDSNGDGLVDYHEVNNVVSDLDGDGTPNGWDWDNDDDLVVDSVDISPFGKTSTNGKYSLDINTTGEPIYVNVQLRTADPAHMRLIEQVWDWPYDDKGQMQDLDNSKEDLTIAPMLEFSTDFDIDGLAVAEYGIFVDQRTVYVPLLPIWDQGNTVALQAKLFIPDRGGPAQLSMNISLNWRVTGHVDHPVSGLIAPDGSYVSVDLAGVVRANASTAGDREGLEILDNGEGKILLKAYNGKYLRQPTTGYIAADATAIDPNCEFVEVDLGGGKVALKSVYNNHYLYVHGDGGISASMGASGATAFTKASPWYRAVPTNLATYPEDFAITGLVLEENHGTDLGVFHSDDVADLTAANIILAYDFLRNATNNVSVMPSRLAAEGVNVSNATTSFEHRDLAVVSTSGKGLKDLVEGLPDNEVLPVVNIIEDLSASLDLRELGGYGLGTVFSADLGAQEVASQKALKTNWYDTDRDEYVETAGVLSALATYNLPHDALAVLVTLTLAWNTGERTITRVGDDPTKFQVPDLDKITDIAFNVVTDGLAALGAGWEAIEKTVKYKAQLDKLRGAKELDRLVKADMEDLAIKQLFSHMDDSASGSLKWVKRISTALEVVGYVLDIGLSVYTLIAMGCASGWSMSGTWSAVLTAVLTLAYGLAVGYIAGMLALCGPAGWVFAGVFLLLVAFSEFVSWLCGGSSWVEGLISDFLKDLSKQIQRSKVDLTVAEQDLIIDDKDGNGLTAGDRVTYDCDFYGKVTANKYTTPVLNKHWWSMEDLVQSYIIPSMWVYDPFVGYTTRGEYVSIGETTYYSPPDTLAYGQSTTRYNTSQYVDLTTPCMNYPFITVLIYAFKYFYEDCFAFLWWWCDRDDYATLKIEPWNTFYFDVLPNSLDDLTSWWAITPLDADGDGLDNADETTSHVWLWDTDGDRLGDRFEQLVGTDPTSQDTDGDGLDDRLEMQLGTNASSRDTDGDGLEDAEEHRGWVVNFNYSDTKFHWLIATDPRLNDTDGDGLDDRTEYYYVLNPMSADTDGDGVLDPNDYMYHKFAYGSTFAKPSGDAGGSPTIDLERAPDGHVYGLVDLGSGIRVVIKYNPDGTIEKDLGILGPYYDIEVDSNGDLYILKYYSPSATFQLHKYDGDGTYVGQTPCCSTASAFALDDANGWMYFLSGEMGVISKHYKSNGTQVLSWLPEGVSWGHHGWGSAAVDDRGYLYATSLSLNRVFKFAPNGTEVASFTKSMSGNFNDPRDVDVDGDGNIYVVDSNNHRLFKLDPDGYTLGHFGGQGSGDDELDVPTSVVHVGDWVYVADSVNCRILNLTNTVTYAPPNETFTYTDSDGDGLTDAVEEAGWTISVRYNATSTSDYNVTSDPLLVDTDGDGLTDKEEKDAGTDPRLSDTDGDGESDAEEAAPSGMALLGMPPGGGSFVGWIGMGTDPTDGDTDGDGLGDGVEVSFASDPNSNDTEGDGLDDLQEFLLGANPNSADSDGDGLDDLAEILFTSDLLSPDADGDFLFDSAEHALDTDPRDADSDDDGLIDALEVIFETDPLDPDTDDDGLADGFEINNSLNASNPDTDGDNVTDAEELARGLNPFSKDSDGDWIPDELDLDHLLVLDDEVVLVADPDVPLGDLEAVLSAETTVVTATPEELLQDYASAPYVVVVGRPDADNGTAGAIVADLLNGTGEALEAVLSGEQHMAVRYGPWAPTQTVIMLTEVGPSDALRTLSILKSMRMTVTDGSVHAEYRNPRACFLQDFGDTVRATDASVWTKLDDMATFNVTITRYDDTSAPVPLTADTGLEDDDLAMGRYLEVILGDEIWGDGVDLVTGGQVKVFYTIEDLDRTGDGDVNDTEDLNETTLRLYWLDEATGNWSLLHPDLDWVNETGLNTTDLEVHGRQYAGCIWAVVHRPLTLAVVGRDTTVPTIAGAGDDVEVDQGDTVTFNGTMSTGNGGIANLTWTFEYDGATVALYGPTPSFTFDLPGAYAVTLTVTDALDRTAQTTINVIVAEVFLPTIARTGDEKVAIVGDTVTFDGTASTGNGDIATYTWTFEYEGATVTLDGATPSHTFDLPGVYTVTLNVTDARDRWGMATMNVTVIEETEVLPTIARTGDDVEIDQGESVTFDGTASTGNGDIVAYEWTFEYDGSTVTLEGAEPSFTFDLPGEYNVTLNVTDALGHTGETTFMVTVGEMVPTIALPGDDLMVGKDDEVSFDGTASTGNGDIVAYRWTFGYDGATVTLEGAMPSFKFEIPGTYTVTLNVTDSKDRTGESTFTVTVREVLPTVAATGGDMEAKVGRQVAFDGTTSTGNGEIVQYNWTFLHDGQTVTLNGAMPVYTFEKPGEYVVTLTVTDSHGRTDDDTFTVKVAKEADGDDGGLSTTVITGIGIAIIIVIILLVALLGGRAGGSSRGTGRDEDEPEDGPVEAPYEPPNDLLTEDDLEVEVDEPDDIIEDGDADLEAEAEAPDDEPVVDDITDLLAELEEESKEKE